MESKDRRKMLENLAALVAAPLLLGRRALLRTLASRGKNSDGVLPRITPPAHSVKRRG